MKYTSQTIYTLAMKYGAYKREAERIAYIAREVYGNCFMDEEEAVALIGRQLAIREKFMEVA